MAEKYRAKSNNINEEVPEMSEKEMRKESDKKGGHVGAKTFGEYAASGVGGKLVDMAAKTKLGQDLLNRASRPFAQNPITSRLMKKADDSGLSEGVDKAVDTIGNNPEGLKKNDKNPINSKNGLEKKDSLNSSESSSNKSGGFNLFNKKSEKNDSFFRSAFRDGEINLFKLIGKKYVIIGALSFFGFLLLLTVVVSAKDFANLDLTNGITSMNNDVGNNLDEEDGSINDDLTNNDSNYFEYNYQNTDLSEDNDFDLSYKCNFLAEKEEYFEICENIYPHFSFEDNMIKSGKITDIYLNEPNLVNIKIEFKTTKYVSNHNADEIIGNTYYWYIDKNNYDKKEVRITFEEDEKDFVEILQEETKDLNEEDYNNLFKYTFIILGLIVLFVILFIFLKVKASNKK